MCWRFSWSQSKQRFETTRCTYHHITVHAIQLLTWMAQWGLLRLACFASSPFFQESHVDWP
eukprot:scaffold97933_cov19-Prasinocladus_malaysianus.AAC.1